jgi:hypothetical protein
LGIRVEPPTRTTWIAKSNFQQWDSEYISHSYLINIFFLDVGILEDLLDGLHGLPEEIHVELFEFSPRESFREVIAVLKAFDFDSGALLATESPFCLFDFPLQFAEGPEVGGDIGASLLLVGLDKVVNDTVVEVFTTEMGVACSCEDLEDTVIDRE